MAENSKIEWTHHTFNPWSGCTKVSPACDHCYAEVNYSVKMRGVKWGKYGNRIVASDSMWNQPLIWNRKAEAEGVRKRVFCASLADVFEGSESMPAEAVADLKAARRRLFKLIQKTPNLDWLLLTKRPENIYRLTYEAIDTFDDPEFDYNACGDPNGLEIAPFNELYPNVWLGTTVENQKYADERVSALLKVPATVHFLSVEPMLGYVDLGLLQTLDCSCLGGHDHDCPAQSSIGWVIIGGESGPGARPFDISWARQIIAQCKAADVPVFVKQLGSKPELHEIRSAAEVLFPAGVPAGAFCEGTIQRHETITLKNRKGGDPDEWPEDLRVREFPKEVTPKL